MANNIDRRNVATDEAKVNFVKRIEALNRQKESEKGSFMKRCATLNEEIKAILDEAKAAGVPKPALKAVIKTRQLEEKVKQAREELEADDLEIFTTVREALGDYASLPLGAAAIDREEGKQDETTAAIVAAVQADEATSTDQVDNEETKAAKAAAIKAQRDRDAAEFEKAEPAKPETDGKVTSIDPKSARANRDKAASQTGAKLKVVGAEPGKMKF